MKRRQRHALGVDGRDAFLRLVDMVAKWLAGVRALFKAQTQGRTWRGLLSGGLL